MAGYLFLSVRETSIATASVLGVIAGVLVSLGVIWKAPFVNRPARFVWRRLVVMPREERAREHAEAIRAPIMAVIGAMREENGEQHRSLREELGVLAGRIKDVEEALTAPRKERVS